MSTQVTIKGRSYQLPMYLPDATLGVARSLDSLDLAAVKLEGVMVNTYHLIQKPGEAVLQAVGGIKQLMNWPGFVSSDSGGFQLFSLIQKNPELGKITDDGIALYTGPKKQRKILFTPEDSIRMQFAIGSDVMICLDDFTPPDANEQRIKESVERTIAWAKRAKMEFLRQFTLHHMDEQNRPLLLAPIQGHTHPNYRRYCSEALQEIGFDIYGLGGWPLDQDGKFDYSFCQKNAELTPKDSLRFALGVGTPENMVRLYLMGYQFFDCVLPTRDARHGRLYVFKTDPSKLTRNTLTALAESNKLDEVFGFIYLNKSQLATDTMAVSEYCDCPICSSTADKSTTANAPTDIPQVSRAYLHHLFKIGDSSAHRLASLHNLRTYARVMEILRQT